MTQGSGSQHRYSSNEAAPDLARALALRSSAARRRPRLDVVGEPDQGDGVEGPVELAVAGPVEPMAGDLPGGSRDWGHPPALRTRPRDRSRPACDQPNRSCAALIGPTPGCARRSGARCAPRARAPPRRSAASAAEQPDARAVKRRARTVMRCSSARAAGPQPRAALDQVAGGEPAEFRPEVLGGVHDAP